MIFDPRAARNLDPSAEATAGTVLQTASPLLSAIPIAGPILSSLFSVGGGLLQKNAAAQQKAQGLKMQQDALNTPLTPLRPEFLAALHNQMLQAHSDMPGFEANKDILSQQLADQIRGIRMSSPNGNATLAAIANGLAAKNRSAMQLGAANSQYQEGQQDKVNASLVTNGLQGVGNEAVQREQRTLGLTSAAQMLNNSMLNKQAGYNQIASGIARGATSIEKNSIANNVYNPQTGVSTPSSNSNNNGSETNNNHGVADPTPLLDTPYSGTPTPLLDTSHGALFQNGQLTPAGQQYYLGAPGTTPANYTTNGTNGIGNSTPTGTSFSNPFAAPDFSDAAIAIPTF